jgi:hypothetical protein
MQHAGYRYEDPCYAFTVEQVLGLKFFTGKKSEDSQGIVYHRSSVMLLQEARQFDDELDRIAKLMMAFQLLDMGVCFQKRVDEETLYCLKPRHKLTRDHVSEAMRLMVTI